MNMCSGSAHPSVFRGQVPPNGNWAKKKAALLLPVAARQRAFYMTDLTLIKCVHPLKI